MKGNRGQGFLGNRGQIAIFVIIAIVIVGVIGLVFFVSNGVPTITRGQEFSPESFIDLCVREAVRENVNVMLPQGGFVNPTNYHSYKDVKVTYLCQNINNYDPCINQFPAFMEQVSRELEREIDDDLVSCFDSLQIELGKRNYEYSGGLQEIDINLKPEVIEITVTKDFSFSKGDLDQSFTSFRSTVQSPLGKLSNVAGNFLVYEESQRCYAENVGWVLLYGSDKGINIKKDVSYDSTKIYTIVDTDTGKEMNIAIRGCVVEHGFYGS